MCWKQGTAGLPAPPSGCLACATTAPFRPSLDSGPNNEAERPAHARRSARFSRAILYQPSTINFPHLPACRQLSHFLAAWPFEPLPLELWPFEPLLCATGANTGSTGAASGAMASTALASTGVDFVRSRAERHCPPAGEPRITSNARASLSHETSMTVFPPRKLSIHPTFLQATPLESRSTVAQVRSFPRKQARARSGRRRSSRVMPPLRREVQRTPRLPHPCDLAPFADRSSSSSRRHAPAVSGSSAGRSSQAANGLQTCAAAYGA